MTWWGSLLNLRSKGQRLKVKLFYLLTYNNDSSHTCVLPVTLVGLQLTLGSRDKRSKSDFLFELCIISGLETNFFTNSQTFVSGFNLNSQFAVSNSQLVSHFWTFFNIAMWYGFSFLRLELGSSFSPSLAEDSPHLTSFFRLKKCVIFSAIAVTWLDPQTASPCCEALWLFNAFTVDWLKHLRD